ncbi:hypothetical protein M011DRAFT_259545 [Sporormia fimetaria CBS 119925]|uniref:Rhodopsin domain-containing protein n=1 Tax=Sporormia fimetaria CBS 119925 TaxID=1340428 RepID=A0A6A6UY75_9PLEO|nr:hypothetical protein M011DRAFT_259545 [Sporormia fimetaria CBS 119925]
MWDVPIDLYNRAALIQFLSEGAFLLSICCTKISVLLFFKRLEPTCTVTLKRIIWGVIAFTAAYTFALLLAQIFLCQHTASYWNIPRPDRPIERTCGDQDAIYILQGSLDVFSTVYSILIPCLVLRRIPLAMFQRYGLRAVAGTSVFVLGAAIARAVFLFYLTHSVSGDSTWNGFNVFVSEQLECQLAIILASAPFLQRFAPQYSGQPLPALQHTKDHSGSVVSRVSSSLSSRRWRFPFGRKHQKTEISQPLPQPAQIPEWEFETFDISQRPQSPTQNALSYDRYLAGMYGPPAPPKDSRELFEQYRREHRAVV